VRRQTYGYLFPAIERHCPLAGTKLYCLVTEAQGWEQTCLECYLIAARPGIEPTTAWSQVRHPNHYNTKPPLTKVEHKSRVGQKWNKYAQRDGWFLLERQTNGTSQLEYNLHKNSFINRCLFNFRWFFFTPFTTIRPILYHHPSIQSITPVLVSSFLYTILLMWAMCVNVLCSLFTEHYILLFVFSNCVIDFLLFYVAFIFVHGLFALILC